MSKINITFSLPEEKSEYRAAIHGIDYQIIISDLDNWLRSCIKHSDVLPSIQDVRDMLWELVNDAGVADDFS